jgi:hypothetical protein
MSPDEIVSAYPSLTPSDVYAALAYYHDHRADIDADIKADDDHDACYEMRLTGHLVATGLSNRGLQQLPGPPGPDARGTPRTTRQIPGGRLISPILKPLVLGFSPSVPGSDRRLRSLPRTWSRTARNAAASSEQSRSVRPSGHRQYGSDGHWNHHL